MIKTLQKEFLKFFHCNQAGVAHQNVIDATNIYLGSWWWLGVAANKVRIMRFKLIENNRLGWLASFVINQQDPHTLQGEILSRGVCV